MNSSSTALGLSDFQAHAEEASRFLKSLANEHRLLVLCYLLTHGEMPVNALVAEVGLSQSALSQHLARLREDGLVTFRRESQTLRYRVCDDRAARLLAVLKDIFCPDMGLERGAD